MKIKIVDRWDTDPKWVIGRITIIVMPDFEIGNIKICLSNDGNLYLGTGVYVKERKTEVTNIFIKKPVQKIIIETWKRMAHYDE